MRTYFMDGPICAHPSYACVQHVIISMPNIVKLPRTFLFENYMYCTAHHPPPPALIIRAANFGTLHTLCFKSMSRKIYLLSRGVLSLVESGNGQFLQGGKRKSSVFWGGNWNSNMSGNGKLFIFISQQHDVITVRVIHLYISIFTGYSSKIRGGSE